jgi:nucleotide-binding universal stress UspA family protein
MSKLMVPIDGSESSMHALDHAILLAKERRGLELSLLNVHPDPIVYGEI